MNPRSAEPGMRIMAVVVLYHTLPVNSRSFQSLQNASRQLPPGSLSLRVILYDNTPGGQKPGELPADVVYQADPQNGGTAAAYNHAMEVAVREGIAWLLVLDQDSVLPVDFFRKLCPALLFAAQLDTVAAVVPCIACGDGRITSPWQKRNYGLRPRRLPVGFIGIPPQAVYAANSACTFKVSALKAMNGFDPRFPLWSSDLFMFHRLHQNHFRLLVAGHIHVEHEASILDLQARSTPARYEDMLLAEEAFYDQCLGRRGHLMLLAILLHRLLYKLWTTHGSVRHFQMVARFFLRGLFRTRRHRMRDWEESARRRNPAIADNSLS
jgi:GT2 family glycosyltransferase